MAIDHRSCKDIFYIPEFIQNKAHQVSSREIQTKLKELATTLSKQADRFKQDKQRLLMRKAEILADIRKFRQEINAQLDKLEKRSILDIENKVKSLEDKIEDYQKMLQENKSRVTSAIVKLASTKTNQSEAFVSMKMGEDAANIANKYMEHVKRNSTVEVIQYDPDTTFFTQLKQKKTLGTLTEIVDNLIQVKGKNSYNIKVKSDKQNCNITSACCMKDGTIILVDKENSKLKRVHSHDYTVTDYCDLRGVPYHVCMINNTQVAVTLPLQNKVHLISLERIMKTRNKINVNFECKSIGYANNNLYISDRYTVYMYSLSGRKLNQFREDFSGHMLFSDIQSLAVSRDAARIYVADYGHGLIVLDKNVQVITSFNNEQLLGGKFCNLTEAGNVLLCGFGSPYALEFTSDGELIGEIITSDSEKNRIESICCNQQMSKMYISREKADIIEVYDI
ncbi:uncharacterized protein LOC132748165 [Ruditapes philippinarum]|uniref:uncharacterized protein LOC132748165 n=1 Tax=Ruditapes philippinarum TaxID=129788 RepID=UPI00295A8611|nr:uncharacterized protein LOC132748165 [Ruditapes philippinarum]